jgi:transposase
MRSVREILRLFFELKLSQNEIHRITGVSRGVVQKVIKAAMATDLRWPLPETLDDRTLENQLLKPKRSLPPKYDEPDWSWVHAELKKRGVNMQLIWAEYAAEKCDKKKYSYSQLNRLYGAWLQQQELSMRQDHRAGEKLFLDYAGQTVPVVIDRRTGEARMAQVFVAVLGASNYCYSEASWSQDLHSWINAHVRALAFFSGVPKCLIPDNLKSGVTKAESYDPLVNATYQRFAQHYNCAIRPARSGRPKDKAKVEKGVQFLETWVLARLRNHTFFSLDELNERISELIDELNHQPFQKMDGTRYSLYLAIDLPALQPLPDRPFEFEEWLTGIKVEKDYHVAVTGHFYSVPHQLRGQRVDIRYTDTIVEVFHNGLRVASHARNNISDATTTRDEHRPPQHALYAGMSAETFLKQAESVGAFTVQVITAIFGAHPYPQLAFDKCFGILSSLRKKHGDVKLEAAAEYAIRIGSPTYRVMKAALESQSALPQQLTVSLIDSHENIRGPEQYRQHKEDQYVEESDDRQTQPNEA